MHGLKPGTGKDVSRRLEALLEDASASGQVLFLPPGDYLAGPVALPRNARLAGVRGASRLFGPRLSLGAAGAQSVSLTGVSLDGMASDQSPAGAPLIEIGDCPDVVLDDCDLRNAGANAVDLTRVGGRIERCRVARAGLAAIQSRDAVGLRIEGNTVEDCGNGGILVHRSAPGEDGTLVSGNRVRRIRADAGGTGQNGNGINLFRAHGVVVGGNRVEDCDFSAIRSNGGSGAVISNNSCLNCGETAIYSEFEFEGALIEGNLVDGAAIGISIANFNNGGRLAVCTGNLVRNLRTLGPYPADAPGFGMGISVEADTVVSNNTVEGAPLFGLKLGWGPYLRDVSATGNVIRDCGVGVAVSVVDGSGKALIASNVISNTPGGAIVGYRWSDPATTDLSHGLETLPANLMVSGNAAG